MVILSAISCMSITVEGIVTWVNTLVSNGEPAAAASGGR